MQQQLDGLCDNWPGWKSNSGSWVRSSACWPLRHRGANSWCWKIAWLFTKYVRWLIIDTENLKIYSSKYCVANRLYTKNRNHRWGGRKEKIHCCGEKRELGKEHMEPEKENNIAEVRERVCRHPGPTYDALWERPPSVLGLAADAVSEIPSLRARRGLLARLLGTGKQRIPLSSLSICCVGHFSGLRWSSISGGSQVAICCARGPRKKTTLEYTCL